MRNVALVKAALIVLIVSLVAVAIGSVWTVLTPDGTGVNFPAGLLYLAGLLVGLVGVVLGIVSLVNFRGTPGR
jgi:hypothetical protein